MEWIVGWYAFVTAGTFGLLVWFHWGPDRPRLLSLAMLAVSWPAILIAQGLQFGKKPDGD